MWKVKSHKPQQYSLKIGVILAQQCALAIRFCLDLDLVFLKLYNSSWIDLEVTLFDSVVKIQITVCKSGLSY